MDNKAALVAWMCLVLHTAAGAQAAGETGWPSPQVGDQWKYRTIDLWTNKETFTFDQQLVAIEPDRLVIRITASNAPEARTARLGKSTFPCRTMRNSSAETCQGLFRFPMRVGDSYEVEKWPYSNGNGYFSHRCKVAAEENISVPAGTLAAVRVDCEGTWTLVFEGQRTGRVVESFWYVPAVHRIGKQKSLVYDAGGKLDNQTQTELVQFTRP
jgi:hypothetical protein